MRGRFEVARFIPAESLGEKWKPPGTWPIISESALKATLGSLERTVRASQ